MFICGEGVMDITGRSNLNVHHSVSKPRKKHVNDYYIH